MMPPQSLAPRYAQREDTKFQIHARQDESAGHLRSGHDDKRALMGPRMRQA